MESVEPPVPMAAQRQAADDTATGDPADASLRVRARFLCELARRLHQYGTSAPRLEAAVESVAQTLGLSVQIWSNPTGILLSFARLDEGGDALGRLTQVIRLDPGDINLKRLSEVDAVAECVSLGRIDIAEGHRRLRALRIGYSRTTERLLVAANGVAAGVVAVLLKVGLLEVAVSSALGLVIGWLALVATRQRAFAPGFEAIAAMLVAFVAQAVHASVAPLAFNQVLIASLIVLLPGLSLTTAISELATQSLVSGTARFAGACAVLLKLAFGAAVGVQLANLLGFASVVPAQVPSATLPLWSEALVLALAGANFALLFKTALPDFPLVIASSWLGYVSTRVFGAFFGGEFAVFMAGLVVGVASNFYARTRQRPGALVRVPGIILLVPGSVGLKSLFFVFQRDVYQGLDTAFSLLVILISLVAGLLFGNVLLPPRRSL